MQKGIVYRSTGSWYDVKIGENLFIKARIQGKFRTQSIKTTNPVAVGDEVDVLINDHDEAVIKFIYPRKNYIIRKLGLNNARISLQNFFLYDNLIKF